LGYRRSALSANSLKPSEGSDYLVVTHPFHPLAGQRLEVLFERRMPTGLAFSCDGGALGYMMLPATWTDRGIPEEPARLSYEALVELARVMAGLRRS
jgi:hypothetical protein